MYTYWWYWRVISKKTVVSWCFSENLGNVHFLYTVEWEVHQAKTCLVVLFLGVVLLIQHKITETRFLLRSISKFLLETTPNFVRMESSSFLGNPRSSGGSWEADGDSTGVSKSWIDAWPFWAFTMQVSQILLSHMNFILAGSKPSNPWRGYVWRYDWIGVFAQRACLDPQCFMWSLTWFRLRYSELGFGWRFFLKGHSFQTREQN